MLYATPQITRSSLLSSGLTVFGLKFFDNFISVVFDVLYLKFPLNAIFQIALKIIGDSVRCRSMLFSSHDFPSLKRYVFPTHLPTPSFRSKKGLNQRMQCFDYLYIIFDGFKMWICSWKDTTTVPSFLFKNKENIFLRMLFIISTCICLTCTSIVMSTK